MESIRNKITTDNESVKILKELVETQKEALKEAKAIDQVTTTNVKN